MSEKIICGAALDVLKTLESESVDSCITSPPYWNLRDYGVEGQLGLEPHFEEYIKKLEAIFDEVKRVLKKKGTCWINLGDTYSGNKEGKTDKKVSQYLKDTTTRLHKKAIIQEKCLCQIPSRFAIAMTDREWILRNRIIWHKPNAMPSSVEDRFTVDYEDVFFFVKNKKYYFEQQYKRGQGGVASRGDDADGLVVGGTNPEGRNRRTVWSISTKPYTDAHFATFPETLIEPMILAGCPKGGTVLDPFSGAATTGLVAKKFGRNYIGIEINPEYVAMSEKRLTSIPSPLF